MYIYICIYILVCVLMYMYIYIYMNAIDARQGLAAAVGLLKQHAASAPVRYLMIVI